MRALCSLLLVLAACERPHSLVICHNANCAEPSDPEHDDTLEALRESLDLELDGRPVIDGVELDSFWRGADDVCLYAHDLDNGADNPPATAPAMELATFFARTGPITFEDVPFRVLMEMKSHVSVSKTDRHTPEQRELHARCAWDIYKIISDGAIANSRAVEIEFSSFEAGLLLAVIANKPADTPTPYRFSAVLGVPKPLDSQTQPLSEYRDVPIDLVEFHVQWFLDAQYEAVRSLGVEIGFFMFSATVETFATVEQYEPEMIVTSEARLFRRWLER